MRFNKVYAILFISILMFSCGDPDGYTELEDGALYKVISFGETDFVPGIGQFISYKIAIFDYNNELIYKTNKLGVDKDEHIMYTHNKNGVIQRNLSLLHLYDSVSFRLSKDVFVEQFPEIKLEHEASEYRVEMILTHVEDEMARKNRLSALLHKAELKEEVIVQNYFYENQNTSEFKKWQGLYLKIIENGTQQVNKGDDLILEYSAYFLDGESFDESKGEHTIKYSFGENAQVIQGLNMIVSYLGINSKSEIIIPSKYAFGDAGSSSELIPPSTPLRYELSVYRDTIDYNNQ